ncbi:hypothetical protein GA0115253_1088512, partial [Streptomyces sp. Termitarium-T10T-6]
MCAHEGQEERLGPGGGGDPARRAVQPAPVPVATGRLPQDRPAAGRFGAGPGGGGGEHGGQLGKDGQPGVGGGRPVPDGAVILVRPGGRGAG